MRKIHDEGVTFKSHIDGSKHLFTPENVVDMQRTIGTDIQMVLDECAPYPCDEAYARRSLRLTHTWAQRARRAFLATAEPYGRPQFQYGIVQGSVYKPLRDESCQAIADLDFEGNAIGGLSVGEPPEVMWELAAHCAQRLPAHKPRYLMGVGTPEDLVRCIAAGIDQFDCVLPTRNARHGKLYFWDGIRNLKGARYATDARPLDETSDLALDHHSRAYLRHLFNAGEYMAYTIASAHNLYFFLRLVRTAREHILAGTFGPWSREVLPLLAQKAED
jgi:queuine tRNA-ribosyltransferase